MTRKEFEELAILQAGRRAKEHNENRVKAKRLLSTTVGPPFSKPSFVRGAMWAYDMIELERIKDIKDSAV